MKSAKYSAGQKDEILKQMILERTKTLEFKVTALIKEYAQVYQKIYQKPLDLQYAYISILKKVKYFVQERYGERLSIIRIFYCRYLEQGQWLELVDGIIAESQRRMQAAFFTKKEQ